MTGGPSIRAGLELAGYRIDAVIGQGGMGTVYRAEQLRLGRKVALKIMAPDLANDPSFRHRFLRESHLAASLEHPHVVPIFDAGEVERILYLAMRFIPGIDLRALIRRERRLGLEQALETRLVLLPEIHEGRLSPSCARRDPRPRPTGATRC